MTTEDTKSAGLAGPLLTEGLGPKVWARKDQLRHASTRGGLMCAMYPDTNGRADLEPLYDKAALDQKGAEIERLRAALAKANEQAERFERGWYLRGDALEKLDQWARAYPLKVFPEPLREEWQRAAALLSEKGLSLDRMSASNMRHVINGVRETVAEGLRA